MFHTDACPRCNSPFVMSHNVARKLGGLVGAVAGTISGLNGNAHKGDFLSSLAGNLIAALLGATAGCSAGTVLGAAIDDNILNNYECLKCGHRFSHPHAAPVQSALPEPWDQN